MFLNEIDFIARQEYNQDLLREAARERLIQIARRADQAGRPAYRRLLGWLGARLMTLGARLQAYGTPRRVIHWQ